MAYEIPGVVINAVAGSTTLTQYKIVRVSAAANNSPVVVHSTGVSTGTGAIISLGVLQSVPGLSTESTGRACSVMITGVTKVLASSRAISAGAFIRFTSGANGTSGGRARASSNSTPIVVGIALSSCAASTGTRYITMRLR